MLADTVPLYPLYALLFLDTGLSGAQISALFVLWSLVGIVAEVPTGALADRFSRKGALVAAGVLQAAGFALWTVQPGWPAFAAGFVLWGLSGALGSGALEALLYDGLAAAGAEDHYARFYGWTTAAGLLASLPTAAAATLLFAAGGFELVGWASVGASLATAALAARLPEPPRAQSTDEADSAGYLTTLRAGLTEAAARPAVRILVVIVAAFTGLDALEEYFPLLAGDWGMPTTAVPVAMLGISVAGAVGAALGGRADRLRPAVLAALLGGSLGLLGAMDLVGHPSGLAGVALFYGIYHLVLIVLNARLQQQIDGPARATVTSVAGLGSEFAAIAVFAGWALGGVSLVAMVALPMAAALPRWLHVGSRSA